MSNNDLAADKETNNSTGINFSDKASFVLGFAALLIAFYPYKESAQTIIVRVFNWDISLYTAAGLF
ncbi:hypothetical protein K8Q98_02145, partial [Candidatus Nomurabacteria bacterium]|nr:hypothetical protein [Candidatus Nomurabacteria bacterium]